MGWPFCFADGKSTVLLGRRRLHSAAFVLHKKYFLYYPVFYSCVTRLTQYGYQK